MTEIPPFLLGLILGYVLGFLTVIAILYLSGEIK